MSENDVQLHQTNPSVEYIDHGEVHTCMEVKKSKTSIHLLLNIFESTKAFKKSTGKRNSGDLKRKLPSI